MVEVEAVSKRYGPTLGVEHITFRVARGEILGLLGPNGAGKTTTLRMLTGFMPATTGRILIDGFDLWEDPNEARRRIGYLPDNPPLYPEMTVTAYLAFMAELRGLPRARIGPRIDELVERLDLGPVAGRLVGRLSRGYRQRVGLAQALVHEPDVLVMDEPTIGLDPRQISEMRQLIRGLRADHAMVLSSHILPEVQAVCQRVIILHHGRVLAEDTPEGLARSMSGSSHLMLRVAGQPADVRPVLSGLEGVRTVEENADGLWRLEVEAGRDVRQPLFFALAAVRLPILELRLQNATLEDVFLHLTTDEDGGEAA